VNIETRDPVATTRDPQPRRRLPVGREPMPPACPVCGKADSFIRSSRQIFTANRQVFNRTCRACGASFRTERSIPHAVVPHAVV